MAKLRKGQIPLSETHPDLVREWDYEANAPLTPNDVSTGSNKKVWWRCNNNHSYINTVDHRTLRGDGCPYCSGKRVLKGYNDLATLNPSLVEEWDYENNVDCSPEDISLKSNKKVWWKCKVCGYSWQADPNSRCRGRGCPDCGKKRGVQTRAKTMLSLQSAKKLDDYPELLKEWDYEKNTFRPSEILGGSQVKAWWFCSVCGNSWHASVNNRVRGSGCPKCKKYNRTSFPEQALFYYLSQVYSEVYNSYTDIFENKMELDIYIADINTGVEYDGAFFHSGNKAEQKMLEKYQICKNIGVRLIRVSEFDNQTTSYDMCFVRSDNSDNALSEVIKQLIESIADVSVSVDVERDRAEIMKRYITVLHEKSISYRYPAVAQKWDIEKNKGLRPDQVNAFSNKRYWWKCQLGHSYQATPLNEVFNTKSCPICSNHRVLTGFNDLATKCPELAREWDFERNHPCKPTDVLFSSSKKYWWKCTKGHSYKTGINTRYYSNSGCPYCANNKVLSGYNDLKTTCPELISEWDYKKNGELTPDKVIAGSNRKVWWVCSQGHEWQSAISARSGKEHNGCPYCSNHRVLTGFNDLATLYPNLLEEWDYEKNNPIAPTNVIAGSPRKVWWKCKCCGNEWKTGIASRTGNQKTGCPICGYKLRMRNTWIKRVQSEKRTLDIMYPQIAKEWDYEKNTVAPSEVSPSASLKVWWLCPKGHSYQSWLNDKTGKHKVGCPICNKKRLLSGENDLETLFPEIAKEWDYSKNNGMKPSEITAQNGRKVWWKCSLGHSWEAIVSTRTGPNKTGCPYCSNKKVLPGYNDLETQFPELCEEWDYDKNEVLPSQVVYGSGRKVWWKCSAGHEWQARVVQRTRGGSGCSVCYLTRGTQKRQK